MEVVMSNKMAIFSWFVINFGEVIMREIYNYHPETVMIIISGYGSLESAITAIRLGVKDYFIKQYAKAADC